MTSVLRSLRDLSLRGKVTLTLAVVFLFSLTALLLVLVPVLAAQRQRLLEQDKRLLSTLRRNHEREFIYDQLQRNRESLALHLQEPRGAGGHSSGRVSRAVDLDLGATGDAVVIRRLLGPDAEPFLGRPEVVLLVDQDGEADLVGPGGRPLVAGRKVEREEAPPQGSAPPPGQDEFRETVFGGQRVLALRATLSAAGEPYGRLHLLKSLAPLERSEATTRSLFYGGVTLSFVLVLLLLNLLLSRMVLAPVRRVHDAMARAATGDLQARLPVHSRDEVGSMAESFNRMVGELEASRREIEGYSRNLEGMVEARTGELRASQASLLALKNHLATVIANVGTGVLSLDESGRIETFNERAGEILGLAPETARGRIAGGGARGRRDRAPRRGGGLGPRRARGLARGPGRLRAATGPAHALRRRFRPPRRGPARPSAPWSWSRTSPRSSPRSGSTAWKEAVERVIHEIKNPLTPVGLAAETLKTAWGRDPARFADIFPSAIDMILGAVRDLKELIGEFSRFSRLPPMRPERVDPNALVLDALSPYTQAPLERLKVRVELAPDAPEVEVDADQVKRVLLNVINNALEAMAERGGELRLRTRGRTAGSRSASTTTAPASRTSSGSSSRTTPRR